IRTWVGSKDSSFSRSQLEAAQWAQEDPGTAAPMNGVLSSMARAWKWRPSPFPKESPIKRTLESSSKRGLSEIVRATPTPPARSTPPRIHRRSMCGYGSIFCTPGIVQMTASCPGFASYQNQPNGQVTVNGQLQYASERNAELLLDAWEKYGGLILQTAQKYQLQPAWLIGIMMAESKGNQH